jgi:integrating conjugative element protein (TIGR03757 family)
VLPIASTIMSEARERGRVVNSKAIAMVAAVFVWSLSGGVDGKEFESVSVFTTSRLTVTRSRAVESTTYQLDEADELVRQLGTDLPNDQQAAQTEVFKRMAMPAGKAMVARLGKLFGGVVKAWSLGVTKLPAIVINERYVVYGVYSVDEAVQIFSSRQQ